MISSEFRVLPSIEIVTVLEDAKLPVLFLSTNVQNSKFNVQLSQSYAVYFHIRVIF